MAALTACSARDIVTEPDPPATSAPNPSTPTPAPAPGEPLFAFIGLTIPSALVEGDTARMKAVPVDINGDEILVPYTVTYVSLDPAVATVNETGLVTAIRRGAAEIQASVVIGHTRRGSSAVTYVFSAISPDSIVLTSDDKGWQPQQAQVSPGGIVEWRTPAISWGGMPVTQIYLLDDRYGVIDSVEVKNGSATRRFQSAGFYRYCSGGCWDPPDFGVIDVR